MKKNETPFQNTAARLNQKEEEEQKEPKTPVTPRGETKKFLKRGEGIGGGIGNGDKSAVKPSEAKKKGFKKQIFDSDDDDDSSENSEHDEENTDPLDVEEPVRTFEEPKEKLNIWVQKTIIPEHYLSGLPEKFRQLVVSKVAFVDQ